jgi:hypothetical protein
VERAAISSRDDPVRLLTNLRGEGGNTKLVKNNCMGGSKVVAIASWIWTLDSLLLEELVRVQGLVEQTLHC